MSQSLLLFFLYVSGAQTMHLEHQSLKSIKFCSYSISTFLRIRADPSMYILWVSFTVALPDTFLMFSTICHNVYVSSPRSLYLLLLFFDFLQCNVIIIIITIIVSIITIINLTVSTPAPTTSIACPLTSSNVRSSFMSKYVNSGTTTSKKQI